jgi:XTP/dITP diphosphohydrolase
MTRPSILGRIAWTRYHDPGYPPPMEILLATNNRHKLHELTSILQGHTLVGPESRGIEFEHEETGSSYLENAVGKARTLFELARGPVLADDSGLSVAALNGEPGIYSSRYGMTEGGIELPADERNRYLLSNLEGIGDRRAFFVCCMVLLLDDYRLFVAQETLPGTITETPAGSGGFGYDPVFFLPERGMTVAEIDEAEKNRISHRGRAGRRIRAILDDLHD